MCFWTRSARRWTVSSCAAQKHGLTPLFELPTPPFDQDAYEREHRDRWVDELAKNISQLLHQHGSFMPVEHTTEIYGELMGQAWERHVRDAVKKLHKAQITSNNGKYDFWLRPLDIIIPPQPGAPSEGHQTPRNTQSGPYLATGTDSA